MNSRNNIQRELELLSSHLPFDVRMPVFDLPQGYFESFAACVLAKIKGEAALEITDELEGLSPLLARMPRTNPYSVPQDYFKDTVAPRPGGEEDPMPGWDATGRTMPYGVPAGYFDDFAATVLEKTAPAPAKVVSMFARKWVQYAAAAVVGGTIVLGALLFRNNGNPVDPSTSPDAWVAKKLRDVSNQELEAFILTTEPTGTEMVQQAGNNKTEVRNLLNDIPSSELDAFLNQLPAGTELIN